MLKICFFFLPKSHLKSFQSTQVNTVVTGGSFSGSSLFTALYLSATMFLSIDRHICLQSRVKLKKKRGLAYSSCVQFDGLSMRCPSFSSLKSSSTGIPGYGEPPSVNISHINTPNDHLNTER